ncbi:MAG: hypothetical protein WC325_02740 [Candidatus Bathyarchaeia archaeon]
MAKKRKKENEISVRAPDFMPKKEPIFKDTTGTEALDVFKVVSSIGRIFCFVMIATGIFVTVFAAYNIVYSVNILWNPLFIGVLGLIGVANIFCGLLLLAKK